MASRTDFGTLTEGSEVAEVFKDRIKGRVVVITGVSPKSLGGKVAEIVARHEPSRLILASRSLQNLQSVAQSISTLQPSLKPDLVETDLASFASIRKAARVILDLTNEVHLLINTAAVCSTEKRVTADGFEMQLGVTHLGHFLLTDLLLPQLKAAAKDTSLPAGSVRIINVSSHGHRLSPIRFHDYNFDGHAIPPEEQPLSTLPKHFLTSAEKKYSVWLAYGQSKTANIMHAMMLNRRLGEHGIRSYALHPGSIETELSRYLSPEDTKIIEGTSAVWVTHDQGTSTIFVAALDPALDAPQNIMYLADCQLSEPAEHARDEVAAEKLWTLSKQLTAQ